MLIWETLAFKIESYWSYDGHRNQMQNLSFPSHNQVEWSASCETLSWFWEVKISKNYSQLLRKLWIIFGFLPKLHVFIKTLRYKAHIFFDLGDHSYFVLELIYQQVSLPEVNMQERKKNFVILIHSLGKIFFQTQADFFL